MLFDLQSPNCGFGKTRKNCLYNIRLLNSQTVVFFSYAPLLIIFAYLLSHLLEKQHDATSLNLEPRGGREGKEDDLETRGAAVKKQKPKKLDTARDNWRDWLRTGMPRGIMLTAYAPWLATKAFIDWLIQPFGWYLKGGLFDPRRVLLWWEKGSLG